jgi:hypothetical protein
MFRVKHLSFKFFGHHEKKTSLACKLYLNLAICMLIVSLPYGLVVRITGFHPVGPGSIPGMGIIFKKFNTQNKIVTNETKKNLK